MCKSDASRLVCFHFEKAATGAAAWMGITIECAFCVAVAYSVGAVPAGVALHDLAHGRVGVFLDVEQGVFHGSFLRLFGKPVLTVFKTGLAVVLASVDCNAGTAQYHVVAVMHVHHDAVFLLLGHGFQLLYLLMR